MKKKMQSEKWRSMVRFMMVLTIFGFAIFLKNYLERMESYNTTILAFTYQYGFISRGFLGTIISMSGFASAMESDEV